MGNDKEVVQKLFDEVSERTGMPRVDLSAEDSTALPFGDEMLLHIHYRAEIPEIDFTVPLGIVPRKRKAAVYERLLSANFYWVGTQGATLSYQESLDEVILQFREETANLTAERLQRVMEGFLSVAMKWKERLAKLIENAGDEEESYDEGDPGRATGQGDDGMMLFEA